MTAVQESHGPIFMPNLADISSFWFGGPLGELEQVCLLSMLKQGHKVRLFCYEPVPNAPLGIELVDAREILPRDEFIFHRESGNPALGSNRIRCHIMKRGLGLWLDTDIILIKPINQDDDYIFGWQSDITINNAVLYLPANANVTEEICNFIDQKYPIPPFYNPANRAELERRAILGVPVDAQDLPWGVYGPKALTYFIHKNNLQGFAKAREVFYPLHWSNAHALFVAGSDGRRVIKTTTIAIHLWNYALRRPSKIRPHNPVGQLIVEKDCFVEKFAREQLGFRMKDLL
jgi:hypothetical protein